MCLTHFLSPYEKAHFCVVTALLPLITYATSHMSNSHSRPVLHCLWLNSHYLALKTQRNYLWTYGHATVWGICSQWPIGHFTIRWNVYVTYITYQLQVILGAVLAQENRGLLPTWQEPHNGGETSLMPCSSAITWKTSKDMVGEPCD